MSQRLHHWNAPTLTSAEIDIDALGVDDQLVLRDVKARLFDREIPVTVGRYPIERRIGWGGMGTVYEGVDPELGRPVALKVMMPGDVNAARTKAEARTLAQLSHTNVVTVHEVGQHGERVFLAMEYVEGQTLGEWLAAGPSSAAILAVFAQAGAGLAAAHDAGIAHRDFKPSNVLIRADEREKVIDFGLSRAAVAEATEDDAAPVRLTRTGALLGTPAYMSPEQFRAEPLDARTDVFSFGCVLYEALTGARPFGGDDVASIRVAFDGPPPRRDKRIPRRVWRALSSSLQPDVQRRPTSLRPLLDALQPARGRWIPAAAAGLVLAGGLGALSMDDPPPQPAELSSEFQSPVRAVAFAELRAAPDLPSARRAAETFLAVFGDDATSAERLITEAAIGLELRARSCSSDLDGLCVRELRPSDDDDRCPQAPKASLVPVPRNPDLLAESNEHLHEARRLMHFQKPPPDGENAKAYYRAVSQVKLATADDGLERMLATELPQELDFVDESTSPLSSAVFKAIFASHQETAQELMTAYAGTKGGGDPATVLRAASRTSVTMLHFVWLLASAPTSNSEGFCAELAEQWAAPAKLARDAVAYCLEHAEGTDVDPSICNPVPDGFPRLVP